MRKNKIVKIILILIALILIVGIGGFSYAYLFTDVFKSDKQMFLKYILKNVENLYELRDNDLVTYFDNQTEAIYNNEGSIYITTKEKGKENLNITFEGAVDNKNEYNYQKIKLNYSDDVSTEFDFVYDEDYINLGIPEILKKYLSLDLNDLDDLFNELGIEDSEKIVNALKSRKKLSAKGRVNFNSKSDKKYKDLLLENIKDENITKSKEDDTTKYTWTVTKAELKKVAELFFNEMLNDEELYEEMKNEYAWNEYDIDDFKDNLEKIIEDLKEEGSSDDEEISIIVYVSKNKLLKTEIKDNESNVIIKFENDKLIFNIEEKEDDEDSYKTIGNIILEKIKENDDIAYNLAMETNEVTVEFRVEYSGISSQETVKEKYVIDIDDGKVTLNLLNEKNFTDSIEKQEIKENEMAVLNKKSSKELGDLLQKLVMAIVQLHSAKVQDAKLDKDPFVELFEDMSESLESLNNSLEELQSI